jgi:hypothetical protein
MTTMSQAANTAFKALARTSGLLLASLRAAQSTFRLSCLPCGDTNLLKGTKPVGLEVKYVVALIERLGGMRYPSNEAGSSQPLPISGARIIRWARAGLLL